MIFVDANIFLSCFIENDVFHQRAKQLMSAIETHIYGEYFTSDYVFNEVVGVVMRKYGKENALMIGNKLFNSTMILSINETLLKEAWKLFNDNKSTLNLVDCTNIIAVKSLGAKYIATFDKEFEKIKEIKVLK
ncbi:type II toxin-antitoxin system VapC family toxin [Candidatus Woesearchaeota archaeon]|nr:type II toxin-antitoxin system VapC family toxin [Candidatus Woesearchaeota archaeon]